MAVIIIPSPSGYDDTAPSGKDLLVMVGDSMKTVSLELSKQLKEAGYPQADRDVFYWFIDKKSFTINKEWKLYYAQLRTDFTDWEDSEWCASPTADEILDLLPWMVEANNLHYYMNVDGMVNDGGYGIEYHTNNLTVEVVLRTEGKEDLMLFRREEEKILADAAAKMWLYLKKEGILN